MSATSRAPFIPIIIEGRQNYPKGRSCMVCRVLNNSLVHFAGGSDLAAKVDYSPHTPQIGCFCGQEVKQQVEEVTRGIEYCILGLFQCLCKTMLVEMENAKLSKENVNVLEIIG